MTAPVQPLESQESTPPEAARPRRLGTTLLGGGAVGAAALPVWRVGIGWMAAALAVLAAVMVARSGADGGGAGRRGQPGQPGKTNYADRAWRIAAALAALALVAVAGVRAAGWLVAFCLTTGLVLASYALAGGRSWRGIIVGGLALLPATVRGLGWAADGAHGAAANTDRAERATRVGRAVAGFAVGVALLLIFGTLFRAADPAFAELVNGWIRGISVAMLVRAALGFVLVAPCALGAAYLVRNPRRADPEPTPARRSLGLAEWVIPLTMLDALFGVFVWVQVTVLFGGDEFVLGPGGPDYAVHARGGFVQLGAVTALTLGVVAAVALWAGRVTPVELGLIRLLGGVLCGLTLVIVASALKRLTLYAEAYGFTVPRLLAYAGEVWLGIVFVLLLAAGVRLRAAWLPRATAAAAVTVLLGLAAINPEALMARTHLDRLDQNYPLDYAFLSSLSTDAIDALPHGACEGDRWHLNDSEPWYAWNLSRAHARAVVAHAPSWCNE